MVKTRLIITDINNQKYRFNVNEAGLSVTSVNMSFVIRPNVAKFSLDESKLEQFNKLIHNGASFTINNNSVFNSQHIVNIELEKIGDTDV